MRRTSTTDDDFEYYVTFPSLAEELDDGKDGAVGGENFDFEAEGGDEVLAGSYGPAIPTYNTTDQPKESVVILLGWMGCIDKHLAKYSDIYDKSGCITLRYIMPRKVSYFQQYKARSYAARVLDLIPDMELEENPVFFHVFSNGGALLYRHISELLQTDKKYANIQLKGVIFDSCPSPMASAIRGTRWIINTMKINIVLKLVLAIFIFLFLFLRLCYQRLSGHVTSYEALKSDKISCPQLYLYSRADKVVDYQGIEELITHRRGNGKPIHSVHWEDSEHVSHLRNHREVYVTQCHQFLTMCLDTQ